MYLWGLTLWYYILRLISYRLIGNGMLIVNCYLLIVYGRIVS